jgi:hypothetical protein
LRYRRSLELPCEEEEEMTRKTLGHNVNDASFDDAEPLLKRNKEHVK